MEEERFNICKKCGIYNEIRYQCNGNLAVNPKTNDVCGLTSSGKPMLFGYIKGCGCYIPDKVANPNSVCPAKKW